MGRALTLLSPAFSCHYISYLSFQHRHLSVSPLVTYSHRPSRLLFHSRLEGDQLNYSAIAAIDVSALFASSGPVSAFISTLLASPVIAYLASLHHQFRGHPSSPLWPGSFLSQFHSAFLMSYLSLPHRATPFPDLCGPRLLAIRSTRSHHSRTSRVYLWPPIIASFWRSCNCIWFPLHAHFQRLCIVFPC